MRSTPASAIGLSKLRGGGPPSAAERALFLQLRDNLVALAALVPPHALLPAAQPPMQTFLATSRAMGARQARAGLSRARARLQSTRAVF
jgi:hypothetical protein